MGLPRQFLKGKTVKGCLLRTLIFIEEDVEGRKVVSDNSSDIGHSTWCSTAMATPCPGVGIQEWFSTRDNFTLQGLFDNV